MGSGVVIARSLGPSGRGDLSILMAVTTAATQLVAAGFPSAVTYFVAKEHDAWPQVLRGLRKVMLLQFALAAALVLLLDRLFLGDASQETWTAAVMSIAIVAPSIYMFYALHIFQAVGDYRSFGLFRIGSTALYSIPLIPASFIGLTILSCTAIWVASQILVAAVAAIALVTRARRTRQAESVPSTRAVSRFALTGFLAQVSPIESFRIDTLAVAALYPSAVVGFYSVASSVTNAPRFVTDGIVAVAYPQIASRSDTTAEQAARKYFLAGAAVCIASAFALGLLLPFAIPLVFGDAFRPSVGTAEWLLVAVALISIRRLGSDCLRALGQPRVSTSIELVTLVILGVGLATIGGWGEARGVAAALSIASAVGLAMTVRLLFRAPAEEARQATRDRA